MKELELIVDRFDTHYIDQKKKRLIESIEKWRPSSSLTQQAMLGWRMTDYRRKIRHLSWETFERLAIDEDYLC